MTSVSGGGPSWGRTIAYWFMTAVIIFVMGSGGVADTMRIPAVVQGMSQLGYPAYFCVILGVWKRSSSRPWHFVIQRTSAAQRSGVLRGYLFRSDGSRRLALCGRGPASQACRTTHLCAGLGRVVGLATAQSPSCRPDILGTACRPSCDLWVISGM